jgi:hypothetical protein
VGVSGGPGRTETAMLHVNVVKAPPTELQLFDADDLAHRLAA